MASGLERASLAAETVSVSRWHGALPNALTGFRISLIPVLVWLLSYPGRGAGAAAALVVLAASISDFFDGYLARRYRVSSTLGKLLDPLADKLITVSALIMLASIDREPRVAGWMVVVIVGRELAVTGLRAIALGEGFVLAAEELGKYKMIFQIFALVGLSLHYTYFHVDSFVCGIYFLWISLVISVWSGVDYHLKVIAAVRTQRKHGHDLGDGQPGRE